MRIEDNNLNKLVKKTDLINLDKKENTSFEIKNFVNLTFFNLDEVKNISSEDYNFNIVLNGKINKNLTKNSFNVSIPFNRINMLIALLIFWKIKWQIYNVIWI